MLSMHGLRSEYEIISSWKSDLERPLVSVCCITYNHKDFIDDAIKSFLNQETDYPIEILIHDDASTDGTTDKIREYQVRYPKIIKTVLQVDNILSKGMSPFSGVLLPMAAGKYIAICEGDDYWIEREKLSIQVTRLEWDENSSFVFSPALVINQDGLILHTRNTYPPKIENKIDFQWILHKGGGFYPTATVLIRRSVLMNNFWMLQYGVGDYSIALCAALSGKGAYISKPTAAYRIHEGGITRGKSLKLIYDIHKTQSNLFLELKNNNLISNDVFKEMVNKETYMCAGRLAFSGRYRESLEFIKQGKVTTYYFTKYLLKLAQIFLTKPRGQRGTIWK